MFVSSDQFRWGEYPERPKNSFIRSSKGYPEKRDPAAESPKGILRKDLGPASERKLRQRYAPSGIR